MKTITDFKTFKNDGRKITMITCYDHWSAKILAKTAVDCLLVGDSVSMVVHGFESTVSADVEMMALHTAAVARAKTGKLIITDLPFLAHRKGKKYLMSAADRLMKAGAHVLKIEAAPGQEEIVKYLGESGVPVIGHVGLTPQYVNQFGGYKVQGRTGEAFDSIVKQALELEKAGCHALVLECVPNTLAEKITEILEIPTIGIGAGLGVSGQVLVLQDLLGFNSDFKPRFVRRFAEGDDWMQKAVSSYSDSVAALSFPTLEESFK